MIEDIKNIEKLIKANEVIRDGLNYVLGQLDFLEKKDEKAKARR